MSSTAALIASLPPGYLEQDHRGGPRIGMIVTTVVSFVVVLLRLYARGAIVRSIGLDDVLIVVAWILNVVVTVLSMKVLQYGAGLHLLALTEEMGVLLYKWLVAAQMVYMVALWVCRTSGLLFFNRLTKNMHRFHIWLWIAFAFVTATFIVQILLIALQCIPLKKLWDPTIEGTCLGDYAVFIPTSALTISCDTLLLLLPIGIIWRLQTNLIRKLALGVVLCFGLVAVIASIFRTAAMVPATQHPTDATWYFATVMVWSCAEVSTAIIALSMPALKPLFAILTAPLSAKESGSGPSEGGVYNLRTIGGSGGTRKRGKGGALETATGIEETGSKENLWPETGVVRHSDEEAGS